MVTPVVPGFAKREKVHFLRFPMPLSAALAESKLLSLVLVVALVVAPVASARAYTWEKTAFDAGAVGSEMGRLIAHPTDPDRLFLATVNVPDILAGTLAPADGLWMTADGGTTWRTVNDATLLPSHNVTDLAICATQPDVMYAATLQQGIFKTTDGGATWSDVSAGFSYGGSGFPNSDWGVVAVAVDPSNPDKVYISVAQVGGLDIFNLSPHHPGFFYSHDGGTTWNENNNGLPARSDSVWDGTSRTGVAASIVVLPQSPDHVVLGMTDLSVNTALFLSRTARTDGRIFYNAASGVGGFLEASTGLPKGIQQSPEIDGSVARVSSSVMMLSRSTGPQVNLWASHVSFTLDMSLSESLLVTRNKGLFFTSNGVWKARNSGLPHVAYWVDPASPAGSTLRFEDTYNMGPVAIAPGSWQRICLVGSNRCDQGDPSSNSTKVFASATAGVPGWVKDWDQGLDSSPTHGYGEANASMIAFNADMSYVYATVRWTDHAVAVPLEDDNGVYRVRLR